MLLDTVLEHPSISTLMQVMLVDTAELRMLDVGMIFTGEQVELGHWIVRYVRIEKVPKH